MRHATVLATGTFLTAAAWAQTPSVGLLRKLPEASPGYTLFTPLLAPETYLIDLDGRIVHSWPGNTEHHFVYLLENGNLLRTALVGGNPVFGNASGVGGRVELLDWDGNLLWQFTWSSPEHVHHHDVEPLPNGNVLVLAWEIKWATEAIAAGRNPATLRTALWPESIIEVRPVFPTGGTVVWEWHLWDHLVQDFDPSRANYGNVQSSPQLVDINYDLDNSADWTHANSIDYDPDLDQILLSVRQFSEVWVIDHSTTTAAAAGHTGGRQGRGGDLLYRWGNPAAYRFPGATPTLYQQHDAQWIEEGLPGAGHILLFNNGETRLYSSADELVPPVNGTGGYDRVPGQPFGPPSASWIHEGSPRSSLYSRFLSGVQRMPNGNTLICSGQSGTLLEVTSDHRVVWEYLNPATQSGRLTQGEPLPPVPHNPVHRVRRYPPGYPGLAGRALHPQGPIELYALLRNRDVTALWPLQPPRRSIFTGTGPATLDRARDLHVPDFAGGDPDPDPPCAGPLVFYQIDWPTNALKLGRDGPCGVRVLF